MNGWFMSSLPFGFGAMFKVGSLRKSVSPLCASTSVSFNACGIGIKTGSAGAKAFANAEVIGVLVTSTSLPFPSFHYMLPEYYVRLKECWLMLVCLASLW